MVQKYERVNYRDMSGSTYAIIRAEVETSNELEKRIMKYAKVEGVRMPRARRQLIEKGLAVVETELPEMTKEKERTFREKIERLHLLIRSKKQGKKTKK